LDISATPPVEIYIGEFKGTSFTLAFLSKETGRERKRVRQQRFGKKRRKNYGYWVGSPRQ